jgi:hypothetical protein
MLSICSGWSEPVPKMTFVLNARLIVIDLNICPQFQENAGRVDGISLR